jgi:putative transposase
MQMPKEPYNFSKIMQSVKWNFSFNFKQAHHIQGSVHIWQNRFWDHVIRKEEDLEHHFDYIHWNPVKHQYVETPEAWADSSLRHWISQGYYPASWGNGLEPEGIKGMLLD